MRVIAAVVLGYFMVVGKAGSELGGPAAPKLDEGMTGPAVAELDRALGIALTDEPVAFDEALDSARRVVTPGGRVVYVPDGCRSVAQPYDLLIHFHGAPTVMEPAFERSGIGGVLAILNLGIGSGAYEDAFQDPMSLDRLLGRVSSVVRDLCPSAHAAPARIALSGWSAGYGAIFRIIDRQKDAQRVDAVLLSDGLHAGFEPDGKIKREVNVDQMAPFSLYMDEAVAGRKLMAITHSSIETPYASTTETANFLLAQHGVTRVPMQAQGPRPGMVMTSRADAGSFHLQGYAGGNEQAHADHLHSFGDNLLPYLKELWNTPRG
ncbi:MAG TPA: hypothetical protein VM686_29375 [Polyangiaceae bacterium]|jgi:hypothetical protein|nr:hypothetical protein [Polyangiaceae bacterium]